MRLDPASTRLLIPSSLQILNMADEKVVSLHNRLEKFVIFEAFTLSGDDQLVSFFVNVFKLEPGMN